MKELAIHYLPGGEGQTPQVRVGYRAREGAQAQERLSAFDFALSEEERKLIQWYLEEYLLFPWASHRAGEAEAMMAAKGAELFRAVFGDPETGRLFSNAVNDLSNTRIVIHAADPVGIALPWELMRDPQRGAYGDLARLCHAFVRSQTDLFFDPPEDNAEGTFNILLVISRPGGPENDVPFQSIARPLLEQCAPHKDRVRVDVLRPPTFEQLSRLLSEKSNFYHVLHFDGHGGFPQPHASRDRTQFYRESDEQGRLWFEHDDGSGAPVTGEALGSLLAGKGVPVVVLNACQSGMTHPEAVYPSVGNQLLKAGVGGVVAMAYSVFVASAAQFVTRLYEGLINGEDLSRAVALGREALRAQPRRSSAIGGVTLQDWIAPILLEAAPIRLAAKPAHMLQLKLPSPNGEPAGSGKEIDCPEPPVFGFIGRDDIIFTLERAFRNETTVLLQGMAGIGKTEASVGFARWLADTGALSGPILFSTFERRWTVADICGQIGKSFGAAIRAELGRDWHLLDNDERRQVALDILKQTRCLLIWDNFEPVAGFPAGAQSEWIKEEQADLRKFLVDLRGGLTKVLITSRRDEPWLGGVYRRVPLGGLNLREAQLLAVRVLERAGMNTNQIKALTAYNDLLTYLDGNPLAIQVILPELIHKTPDTLLPLLQAGEAKLSGDDPSLGRTRSLASSLTYRLDGLAPIHQERLGVLGLFQGFVNVKVLAAMSGQCGAPAPIAGLDHAGWTAELDRAAELGLLRGSNGGYHLHPALPWFFHDIMNRTFGRKKNWLRSAFAFSYASYCGYLEGKTRTDARLAFSLFDLEEGNLNHALQLSYRLNRLDFAGFIFGVVGNFCTRRTNTAKLDRLIAGAERYAQDKNGGPLAGRERFWIVYLEQRQALASLHRDFDTQAQILIQLKSHYQQAGNEHNVATAMHQLGIVAQKRRRFQEAENWYQQSLKISEKTGNEHGVSITLHQLGVVAQKRRLFDEAEKHYARSLEIAERLGNDNGASGTLSQLGMIAQERDQLDEAEDRYRRSLAIKGSSGNEHGAAVTLHHLGRVAAERLRFDEAEEWYRRSLEIEERIGDEHGSAVTLHQLGTIAEARGRFDEARDWYERSMEISQRIGDEHTAAGSLHQLGRVAEEQGDMDLAAQRFERAETVYLRLDDPHNLQVIRSALRRVRRDHLEKNEGDD